MSKIVPENIPFVSFFLSLGSSLHLFKFFVGYFISELHISNKKSFINKNLYNMSLLMSIFLMIITILIKYNFILSFLFLTVSQFERYYELNMSNRVTIG